MSEVFSDFMINQHVNSQVELQKVIAERDTLISVLKECNHALEWLWGGMVDKPNIQEIRDKVESTLERYDK